MDHQPLPRNIVRPNWWAYFWLISLIGTGGPMLMFLWPNYSATILGLTTLVLTGLALNYSRTKRDHPIPPYRHYDWPI